MKLKFNNHNAWYGTNNRGDKPSLIKVSIRNTTDRDERRTSTGMSLKGLLIPNIDMFKIKVQKMDKLIALIGQERVLKRIQISIPLTGKDANWKMNNYLKRQ